MHMRKMPECWRLFAGMLPPFAVESAETKALARHCTTGIEPRVSSERIILLDTQVVCSVAALILSNLL